MIVTLIKQPAEILRREIAFDGGRVVAEILSVTVAARGLVPAAPALTAVPTLFGGAVTLELAGGGDGERYLVTGRARLDDLSEHEAELDVAVIDAAWAMPDGGAPYLSIADFVLRFGLEDVVRMTDADGSGRIDRGYLVAQLTDAQAIVETHLAGRYQLPLAEVPITIKLLVADLARSRLYPRGAPDGVAEQAKVAMRMLERIQTGALPIASATPLSPAAVPADPVVVSPGRRQYPDGLADY